MVFRNKRDETRIVIKNKAKLVAQGYNQQEGMDYDETFAPVARLETIMIFLAFATYMNFIIKQFERGISINQEKYVKDLLKKYDINGSSMKTPMVPPNNLVPDLNGKAVNETQYRGMIGSLMYLTASRLDIQFSTCLCARYQANPKESQLIVVKRIFRKSTSAEAEYVAAAGCCANILWMKSQLTDYDIIYEKVPIFCNNTSAIAISNNPVLQSRTKHIDIRYHFIRDHILKRNIELHIIPIQYQLADIFTKPLDEPNFKRLIVELGMLNIDSKLESLVMIEEN
ncbi:retrovirus-related pol polyprotein from transposon TNT 1-94 [Tanacetum coccineum]